MRISSVCLLLIFALAVTGALTMAQDNRTSQQPGQQPQMYPSRTGTEMYQSRTGADQMRSQMGMTDQQALMVHRASQVIGTDVRNSQGDDLGRISDIVLDPSMTQVSYAVLSHGGALGMGAKRFAVPWTALQMQGKDQPALLNISKSDLDNQPGFGDQWPDRANVRMSSTGGTMGAYSGQGGTSFGSQGGTSFGTQGGTSFGTQGGTSLRSGSYGGTLGGASVSGGTGGVSVSPLADSGINADQNRSAQAQAQNRTGLYSGDQSATGGTMGQQASAIKDRRVSEIIGKDVKNPTGNQNLGNIEDLMISHDGRVAYGIVSYGGVLGVGEKLAAVPWRQVQVQPGANVAYLDTSKDVLDRLAFSNSNWPDFSSQQYGRRVHENFNATPYWEQQGQPAPAPAVAPQGQQSANPQAGWSKGCAYQQSFKADQVKTINGTIESVGSFHPEQGSASGLRLRVRTSDGQLVNVHAGPQQYIQDQGFTFNRGDQVTVKGSQSDLNGQSVIMASEIQSNGKTLELRDAQGNPKWDASRFGTGTDQGAAPGQSGMQGGTMGQSGMQGGTMGSSYQGGTAGSSYQGGTAGSSLGGTTGATTQPME